MSTKEVRRGVLTTALNCVSWWDSVAFALGLRPDESLCLAAERCLAEGVGRQDIARAVLDLHASRLPPRAKWAELGRIARNYCNVELETTEGAR